MIDPLLQHWQGAFGEFQEEGGISIGLELGALTGPLYSARQLDSCLLGGLSGGDAGNAVPTR